MNLEKNIKTLTARDFEEAFQDTLSDNLSLKIKEYDFKYIEMSQAERDLCLLEIIKRLREGMPVKAGKHRQEDWNLGWKENLDTLLGKRDEKAILPRYFGKYKIVRWKQNFIKPLSENFERNTLRVIEEWLFEKYLKEVGSIYEFGCGTGHHLLSAGKINKKAHLYGLDWARSSQQILEHLKVDDHDKRNISGNYFDFFNPDHNFELDKNSGVYTVAALEQTGDKFNSFLEYLLENKNKPVICIHTEPIAELLDADNLVDYLSIEYFKERNYLSGFLTYLRNLEQQKKIKIHQAQRTYIGSLFIEGYSVVVWSPIPQ
ncbi:hypothetical protein HY967_00225 [Candidatus Jorgensenbacteria bacterium]|nr:hypothetical protein [Candidatus Jorgensenbacteria bacterium]